MKLTTTLSLLLVFASTWILLPAQKGDPYSVPPGAPIFNTGPDDLNNRLIPNHPGNAGQKVQTSNFAIIESTSANSGHTMSTRWQTLLTGMGHTATVYPQTALDNISSFAAHDVLIVSSGVIALTAARVFTVQQFLQSGRPVYLQGEYLTNLSSNQAFQTIVNATGGSFAVGGTVSGSLVPTMILNQFATTPNSVTSLPYHWYGASGSGCNNLEYFMRYGASNIGFVYCPQNPAYGDMIQSTDQDWVNQLTSPALMQNIIYALLNGNACSVVCGILDAGNLDLQARERDDQGVDLQWTTDGELAQGKFIVECNGTELGQIAVEDGAGMTFQFVDMRIPDGLLRYRVRHLDLNGQETISGETVLDIQRVSPGLRVATGSEGFKVWLSQDTELESLSLSDLKGQSFPLPMQNIHSFDGQDIMMQGRAAGIYHLRGISRKGEIVQTKLVWMEQ